jgi:hypothetical protein
MVEGRYKLRVIKKGFNDFVKEIHIKSDDLLELNIKLAYAEVKKKLPSAPEDVKIKEESGKLMLFSDPPGKPAQVDDIPWDRTPVILADYPAGRRRIKIGDDFLQITLPPYGIKRLLWKDGGIREVNTEIRRPDHDEVKLESVQIAFSKSAEDLQNWKTTAIPRFPSRHLSDPVFKIDEDEWRLLCFLTFTNSSNDTVQFAQEFKIDSDDGSVYKHEAITRALPRAKQHPWLYFLTRSWSPGYYSLKINDDRGPMAISYFSLHF